MNKGSPPKDDSLYLLDIGYPWLVTAIYNRVDKNWSYAHLEVDLYKGKWEDAYFITERVSEHEIKHWMDYPKKGDK